MLFLIEKKLQVEISSLGFSLSFLTDVLLSCLQRNFNRGFTSMEGVNVKTNSSL